MVFLFHLSFFLFLYFFGQVLNSLKRSFYVPDLIFYIHLWHSSLCRVDALKEETIYLLVINFFLFISYFSIVIIFLVLCFFIYNSMIFIGFIKYLLLIQLLGIHSFLSFISTYAFCSFLFLTVILSYFTFLACCIVYGLLLSSW